MGVTAVEAPRRQNLQPTRFVAHPANGLFLTGRLPFAHRCQTVTVRGGRRRAFQGIVRRFSRDPAARPAHVRPVTAQGRSRYGWRCRGVGATAVRYTGLVVATGPQRFVSEHRRRGFPPSTACSPPRLLPRSPATRCALPRERIPPAQGPHGWAGVCPAAPSSAGTHQRYRRRLNWVLVSTTA